MSDTGRRLSPLFTWRSSIVESGLSSTQRHVALTLSLHMNERGGSCFPTHDQLREETGLGRSTVIKALRELESEGWLSRVPGGGRRRGGNGQATEYTATVPEMDGSEVDTVQVGDANRPAPVQNRPAGGHQDVIQDENSERPELVGLSPDNPPPVVKVDGRDVPFDALAKVCEIREGSPRLVQVGVALNGPKGQPRLGLRRIYWAELMRWAGESERRLGHLRDMVERPEEFSEFLAKAIRRRGALFVEQMPGIRYGPLKLRDWFLDLEPLDASPDGDGTTFDWGDTA